MKKQLTKIFFCGILSVVLMYILTHKVYVYSEKVL